MHDAKEHWEDVWTRKKSNEVSWYQQYPKTSIDLILSTNTSRDAKIIDVGGGDSNFVDKLLDLGFKNITILDISAKALERSKKRLGQKATAINWIDCDIREFDSEKRYDVWHDRALLQCLTGEQDMQKYMDMIKKHVNDEGYVIISSFSTRGPMMCSGLDTRQHSEEFMKKLFFDGFEHIKSFEEEHKTPFGVSQIFTCNVLRKIS